MKYFLIVLFSFSFVCSKSQSLTVYDLAILNKITEIEWINYYLVLNKDFKYEGDFGVNEGGWKVYKFTRGQSMLEVDLGSGNNKEGEFMETTQLIYNVYDESSLNLFYYSLNKYKFNKTEEGKNDNGNSYSIWIGTLNMHDLFTIITITKKEDKYEITLCC